MDRLRNALVLTTTTLMIAGCVMEMGSGRVQQERRDVADFDTIVHKGSAELNVERGDFSVSIEAEDNVVPTVTTKVTGGTLHIGRTNEHVRSTRPVRVSVTMPDLEGLRLNGSGDGFVGRDLIDGDCELDVAGSGSIRLDHNDVEDISLSVGGSGRIDAVDLTARDAAVHIGGSGRVRVNGVTSTLDVNIGGSGRFDGNELHADAVKVGVAGSGRASVHAHDSLIASTGGSGNIYYRGTPDQLTTRHNGSGRVHARD